MCVRVITTAVTVINLDNNLFAEVERRARATASLNRVSQ